MRATEGILDDHERAALVERTHAHGGRVSWASRPDGPGAVYELNLSYLDALCTVEEARDPAVLAAKALAAHSILFAFLGVPAVYYHSLVGSPPDLEGMVTSRINRRINRAVLDADRLGAELREDPRRRACSRACASCSRSAGSTRRSRRSAPSTSSGSTTGSSRWAGAAGPRRAGVRDQRDRRGVPLPDVLGVDVSPAPRRRRWSWARGATRG